jgi:hypothetical protein
MGTITGYTRRAERQSDRAEQQSDFSQIDLAVTVGLPLLPNPTLMSGMPAPGGW